MTVTALTPEDRELIGSLRADLAALARDVAHVQQELETIRVTFSRIAWLVFASIGAAMLRFVIAGGIAV